MEAVAENTLNAKEKGNRRETFNVFKAASVTLWLRHCTRDYSAEIIATT